MNVFRQFSVFVLLRIVRTFFSTDAFLSRLIDQMPKGGLSHDILEKMDSLYGFNQSRNSEIRFDWYMLCLKSGYEKVCMTCGLS